MALSSGGAKMTRKLLWCGCALALAIPGAALADHGRAGLWNVSTTMTMAMPQIPPEALAQMRAMGMKLPGGRTFASQICMTEADVKSDRPPAMDRADSGCQWTNVHVSGSGMSGDMACHGKMEGHGTMQVSYNGTDHYRGEYSFKGSMDGRSTEMKSSFSGNWVKADCGAVKPMGR